MVRDSQQAAAVLSCVSRSNERLLALSHKLRTQPEVTNSSHLFLLRDYPLSDPLLGAYADARLQDDRTVVWSLEIRWNEDNLRIESNVSINDHEQGQSFISEFPERVVVTIDEFVSHLEQATSELVASADLIDLGSLARA